MGTHIEREKTEIVARVAEIALRVIFENFNYKFGGNTYCQESRGPIGAKGEGCRMRRKEKLGKVEMQRWS